MQLFFFEHSVYLYIARVRAKSCLILLRPTDWSLLGSSAHVILQARTLEWVASFFSSGSPQSPGIEPASLLSPVLSGMFFTTTATWEPTVSDKHLIRGCMKKASWVQIEEKLWAMLSLIVPEGHEDNEDSEKSYYQVTYVIL